MGGRFTQALVSIATVLCVSDSALATAAQSAALQPVLNAIRHGDCGKAIKTVNDLINTQDAQVDFIAARMADEGVCANEDSPAATRFYKRSFELGNRDAGLEYGAKVGLGEGATQNYEQAGEICRTAALDAARQLSAYSLGYACTIRGVAGKILRENLPKGAIVRGGGAALVSFTVSNGALQIRSLPHVGTADPEVGSYIQHPLIDARDEINKAWQKAMTTVPKPDARRLESKAVDLPLDLEMSIEQGRDSAHAMQSPLFRGESRESKHIAEVAAPVSEAAQAPLPHSGSAEEFKRLELPSGRQRLGAGLGHLQSEQLIGARAAEIHRRDRFA